MGIRAYFWRKGCSLGSMIAHYGISMLQPCCYNDYLVTSNFQSSAWTGVVGIMERCKACSYLLSVHLVFLRLRRALRSSVWPTFCVLSTDGITATLKRKRPMDWEFIFFSFWVSQKHVFKLHPQSCLMYSLQAKLFISKAVKSQFMYTWQPILLFSV